MKKDLRLQDIILGFFGLSVFVYIVVRAVRIPITHDEAGTILNFASQSVSDIVTYKDPIPNNHLLNTLLIKALVWLGGLKEWVCRLPNIIAGAIYLWFSVSIASLIFKKDSWLQLPFLILCCANPFLMEFFSLARGYGLSVALMMVSLYFFMRDIHSKDIIKAVAFGGLAVYANLTLLNYFMALLVLVGFIGLWQKQSWSWWRGVCLITVVLVLCMMGPVYMMIKTNQFHFWSSNGFYHDTYLSLLQASLEGKKYFGNQNILVFNFLIGVGILVISVGVVRSFMHFKMKALDRVATKASILFLTTILYNIVQNELGNIPFLNARTSLFLYPLFMISITAMWYEWSFLIRRWIISLLFVSFSCFALLHIVRSYNLHSSYEWWYDGDNKKVVQLLEAEFRATDQSKLLRFKCNWLFQPSMTFYVKAQVNHAITLPPYHQSIDTLEVVDFYYITSDDYNGSASSWFKSNYEVFQSFAWDSRLLMKKKQ